MPAESNKVNSILWGHTLTSNQTPNQVPISIPYPMNYFVILGVGKGIEIGIWDLKSGNDIYVTKKLIFLNRRNVSSLTNFNESMRENFSKK